MEIKQYQIVLVNLDPTIGSEIKKTRPCVVISPNEMNKYLRTVVIAPMTTSSKNYPTKIKIKYDTKLAGLCLTKSALLTSNELLKYSEV